MKGANSGKLGREPAFVDRDVPSRGVRTSRFRVDGDQFAVLSYVPDVTATRRVRLTRCEQAIACGIMAGRSNAQIARDRSVSQRTVANQMSTVLGKLGITSRTKLASLCRSRAR